jgi:electron transfer flavoprotein beta subunit
MGPSQADSALRKTLSFGADDAILVSDRAFAGSDTLATSYALAAAIKKIREDMPVDLVFAGKQTIDGDTAQVGPGIAKRLGLQLLTYVAKIAALDLDQGEITIHRRAEGGVQVLRTKLPCLVTVLEGINEMRFATMDDMFRAARHPLRVWDKSAVGIEDLNKIGLKGSPTVVAKVFAPQAKSQKAQRIETQSGAPKDLAATLLTKLFTHHPQLEREIAGRAL